MDNLIGKTADETRDNIRKYATNNNMTILEDRVIDSSLVVGKSTPTRYMTISNGKQTVRVTIVQDGRISREIR